MTATVPLRPDDSKDSPSYRKIRFGSRVFAWIFTGLFLAFGLFATAFISGILAGAPGLYVGPHALHVSIGSSHPVPADFIAFANLGWPHRLVYALTGLLLAAPVLVVFAGLRSLFRLYMRGAIFERANATHLKAVGAGLIAYGLAPAAAHLILAATGLMIDKVWFHLHSLQAVLLGGLVFVIAQVMEVGREIEEERSQFV